MTMKEDNFLTNAISKKISRRSFVKWTAAVGATASMSGLVVSSAAKMAGAASNLTSSPVTSDEVSSARIVDWVPTHCLVCHGWCGLAVGIDSNDVVRKVDGIGGQPKPASNPHTLTAGQADGGRSNVHDDTMNRYCAGATGYLPYHIHNRGRICAKGNDAMEHLYDPDKVKYPLKRVGDRGSGKWERISWKAAYTTIGETLRGIGGRNTNRMCFWVGRNEDHHITDRFTAAYGTRNHIEHTSICESSRHTTQIQILKDKFPLPNIYTHTNGTVINDTRIGGQWTLNANDNCDFFVSCGGNHMESAIPMASYSQRLADVRRHGGRVMAIDVRQSNTMAWADEQAFIKPGTDAALAAGVIHTIMAYYGDATGAGLGIASLKARLDSRPNLNYTGLFVSEEVASGGTVPNGKSLESYVFNGTNGRPAFAGAPIPDGRGAAVAFTAAYAAPICGIPAATIEYLAWAFSGGYSDRVTGAVAGPGDPGGGAVPPKNPIIDSYRGPSKHTNGSYNYMVLRALLYLACGDDDPTDDVPGDALTEYSKRAGGIDRVGGLIHDTWNSSPASIPVSAGDDKGWGGGPSGAGDNRPAAGQRIDNWDYTGTGGEKFKVATHKNDQYVIPGIRASIGLDPFIEGQLLSTPNTNPYGTDYLGNARPGGAVGGGADDNDFIVEALLSFKNNPGYSRCNIALDRDTFTAKNPDGTYRLANYWTIDMNMGDGSLYADIILPEGCFLERYAMKDWEDLAHKRFIDLRQPVRQGKGAINAADIVIAGSDVTAPTSTVGQNLQLYEARSVWRTLYELARAVENTSTWGGPDGDTALIGAGVAPWSGSLAGSFNWSGTNAHLADRDFILTACNGSSMLTALGIGVAGTPAENARDRFNYMRTNGNAYVSADTPNFFRDQATKLQEFYSALFDGTTDPSVGEVGVESNGTFYGTPVYVPLSQAPSASRPYYLTTYRLNVHTHARTASCPRLQEVLGSSWAVMSPTTAAGIKNTVGAVVGVQTGDTVRLYTTHHNVTAGTKVRTLDIEVKVTPRAQNGVVSISHSQGHAIQSFGGDADGTGYDGYNVNNSGVTKKNRFHDRNGVAGTSSDITGHATQAMILGQAMDDYRWSLKPSAPSTDGNALSTTGHGSHPNWVINRTSDPVGASMGFFDTPCDVRKI